MRNMLQVLKQSNPNQTVDQQALWKTTQIALGPQFAVKVSSVKISERHCCIQANTFVKMSGKLQLRIKACLQ